MCTGRWYLVAGFWFPVAGFWSLVTGYKTYTTYKTYGSNRLAMLDTGCSILDKCNSAGSECLSFIEYRVSSIK